MTQLSLSHIKCAYSSLLRIACLYLPPMFQGVKTLQILYLKFSRFQLGFLNYNYMFIHQLNQHKKQTPLIFSFPYHDHLYMKQHKSATNLKLTKMLHSKNKTRTKTKLCVNGISRKARSIDRSTESQRAAAMEIVIPHSSSHSHFFQTFTFPCSSSSSSCSRWFLILDSRLHLIFFASASAFVFIFLILWSCLCARRWKIVLRRVFSFLVSEAWIHRRIGLVD